MKYVGIVILSMLGLCLFPAFLLLAYVIVLIGVGILVYILCAPFLFITWTTEKIKDWKNKKKTEAEEREEYKRQLIYDICRVNQESQELEDTDKTEDYYRPKTSNSYTLSNSDVIRVLNIFTDQHKDILVYYDPLLNDCCYIFKMYKDNKSVKSQKIPDYISESELIEILIELKERVSNGEDN